MKELATSQFDTFPLGSIHAHGWLGDQLSLSGAGLAGHLFEFYRYVARSTWLGGEQEYSELHESAPYWFNYIVPLAWTLDDTRLKTQAKSFVDYTLAHQAEDGWLGPEKEKQTRGIWARSLLFFGLVQYAEADPAETDRIVDAMHRFVELAHTMLQQNFTGLLPQDGDTFDPYGFGVSRTHELPISLMWLYEKHPRENHETIWETIELMFEGGRRGSRDWTTFFTSENFPKVGTPDIKTSGFTHGVNLAQGLRYPTVLYRTTKDESLVQQTYEAAGMVAQYHGSRSGSIVADEHLGGHSSQRGSELCMAVEVMFSYAYLYRFHGGNAFADNAELAAFNALPVAMSDDWWSHQYVTQTNQPWSRNLTEDPFFNVVPYGNTFGLEPNFPCCTVNHPQGYPKYVSSSYVRYGKNGIAHILLAPTSLEAEISGHSIKIVCDTQYPFSGNLKYTIRSEIAFNFAVRIPEWTSSSQRPTYSMTDSDRLEPLRPGESGLQEFHVPKGTASISIHLSPEPRVIDRNGTISIYLGPLLYALPISFNSSAHQCLNWTDRKPLPASETDPHASDHVLEPTSPWNYAIDPDTLEVERVRPEHEALPKLVWAADGPPTIIWVDAYEIDWPVVQGTAAVTPAKVTVDGRTKERVKLVPYAAAKLHIAEFPIARV